MKITTPQTLATVIRDQRKAQKMTQKETADRVGMKQTTVSGFEISPDKSKLETLFKLLSALDLELHVTQRNSAPAKESGWTKEW